MVVRWGAGGAAQYCLHGSVDIQLRRDLQAGNPSCVMLGSSSRYHESVFADSTAQCCFHGIVDVQQRHNLPTRTAALWHALNT